jgi:hypothetical protein
MLWVLTQDKDIIEVSFFRADEECIVGFGVRDIILGEYENKERVLTVIDMIVNHINSGGIHPKVFVMPEK